ncbi:hypothetical protein CPS_3989 [Colwellia psychrerythraea 34H]|uniref:Uncharacterized protein n=1 Tax=Colwellia psychrerythraea (strain 34H / ATCC BAA-681) TaxID=167879 RepID=Q47X23_COLP3|nr:hypothetical protein CPS_3989 [Colwellia psychrerythraea 34H]
MPQHSELARQSTQVQIDIDAKVSKKYDNTMTVKR